MIEKIKGKSKILFHCFIASLFLFLFYSRFVGLGWGLPYPMHPDERNMANAIQSLNCTISNFEFRISNFLECGNPHFFAYGQFSLYIGYLTAYLIKILNGGIGLPINSAVATLSLRIISALSSIINAIIIIKIINVITKREFYRISPIYYSLVIFAPYAIQLAHFGTTESLLMMFYSTIIYFCLLFFDDKINTLSFLLNSSILIGFSMSTKVSSLIFLIIPSSALIFNKDILKRRISTFMTKNSATFFIYRLINKIIDLLVLVLLSLMISIIFSPHNLINFKDFIGSIRYESDVALGTAAVFYTRQFINVVPVWFQTVKIFPYVLGWPVFILAGLGFFGLDWKNKKINLLRFALVIYFIPSAFLYAKWTRFMSPIFPIMTVFAVLFLMRVRVTNVIKIIIIILAILPGLAYLSVYQNSDVRFQASNWIYKNIPNNSYILSETANVVDIPMEDPKSKIQNPNKNYQIISFDFYNLDENLQLHQELKDHLEKAGYIFVPSRRVFANHTCYINDKIQMKNDISITKNKCQMLNIKYPKVNKYYDDLFSGKLGFVKVAEFNPYPKIKLFGKTLITFPDEQAEETWTVFDHPVIRIFKKVKSF